MDRLIIDAKKKNIFPNFKELRRYKDLFLTLSWREFRVRYAQTTIGLLWVFLQPIFTLIIFYFVFAKLAKVETDQPYLVFAIAGQSLWTYFSFVLTNSWNSIIMNQQMVKKIYFPRLVIPLSKAVVGFVDFGVALLMLIFFMVYYGVVPTANVWLAPAFILIGVIAALGIGIWLSALTVRYRDFKHVVPFMVQLGMYITPVAYPSDVVITNAPQWALPIYYMNPMAGVIDGFRWSLFGGDPPTVYAYISFGMVLLIFITGLMYFTKVERKMADFV